MSNKEEILAQIERTKKKIMELELLIYGIDMRCYYDGSSAVDKYKELKAEKKAELEREKDSLEDWKKILIGEIKKEKDNNA